MSDVIVSNINNFYKKYDPSQIINEMKTYIFTKNLNDIQLNNEIGYTFKPLGCDCWALIESIKTNSFDKTIFQIIQKGGDADTNCAVAGSVIGTYLGYDLLPDNLKNNLVYKEFLDKHIE